MHVIIQQQSVQQYRQHHQIVQQNMQRQRMNQFLLHRQVLQQVVEANPTQADAQALTQIAADAEAQGLDLEQLGTRIREQTRLAFLLNFLPENKEQAYAFISMVATLVGMVVTILGGGPTPAPAPDVQVTVEVPVEEIVRLVEEELKQYEDVPPTPDDESVSPD